MSRSRRALDGRYAGSGSGRRRHAEAEGAGALGWLFLLSSLIFFLDAGSPHAAVQAVEGKAGKDAEVATIETIAGGGPLGDGGPAVAARLNLPGGVLEAPDGSLIIIDFGNHRLRRIDRNTGIIETIAGTGEAGYNGDGIPARQAQLARPEYAVFGPTGDLYIADSYNNRVRRVDHATGLIWTVAGTGERGFSGDGGPATQAELHFPEGITIDAAGNLFVSDTVNRRIRRVDARTGVIDTYAGVGTVGVSPEGTPAEAAHFLRLARIAVDRAGNLYVADSPTHRLLMVAADKRQVRTFAGNGKAGFCGDGGPAREACLDYPEGVVVAPNGDVYFGDVGNNRVRRVDAVTGRIETVAGTGEKGFSGDGGPALRARLWSPGRIWIDHEGNILIADILNSRIRRVQARTGNIETVAGGGGFGDGGPARNAILSVPGDVVYTPGKVYVADYGTRRVRCIDLATGVISTVAGGGARTGDGIAATDAELLLPEGIAVHGRSLYIADNLASRVWRVDLKTGILKVFAGNGKPGFSGDGGPATAAQLYLPGAVTVAPDGRVFISDFGNRSVRVVEPKTGAIHTLSGSRSAAQEDPMKVGVVSLEATAQGLFHLVQGRSEVRLLNLESRTMQQLPFPGDGLPPTLSGDTQVVDMAVRKGQIYLADPLGHRVLRFSPGGDRTEVVAGNGVQGFAGDGGPAGSASLFQPGGVAISDDGRELFIADTKNQRIRRVRLPRTGEHP
jgi:sugar lactone lactonase YvrE